MLAQLIGSDAGRKVLAVSLIFATTSAVVGVHMPYLPVWFDAVGMSPYQIGLLGAAPVIVRIFTIPIAGFLADRWGRTVELVALLSWAAFLGFLVLGQVRGFPLILLLIVYLAVVWSPVFPLSETVAMGVIRRQGLDYGRMRLWGSVAFILTNLAGGLAIDRLGTHTIVWLLAGLVLLSTLAAHVLMGAVGREATGTAGSAAAPGRPRLSLHDVAQLARRPTFLLFLCATGAVQSAHAVLYVFGVLHWRSMGITAEMASALWAISIIMEVALFATSAAVLRRLEPVQLIVLGCAASVVRWLAMGLDPGLIALVPLQMAHALTFGASHIGAMHYIVRTVPEHQLGTAQALYSAFTGGIAMGALMLAIGPLYASFAGQAYWAMALVAALGLAASLRLAVMGTDQSNI
ncbi:MAG: MFS transporter [Hyphomicrobiaceae bacterium]|nr:MFS transporter [Hyphomicrobiaceae bacterium]